MLRCFGWDARRLLSVTCLSLACFAVACKKDAAERRPWDGPTKLIHHRNIKPRPASKTDFGKVRLRGFDFNLKVPVNWKQGPASNKAVRDRLQQWHWIWPLLRAYETSKDKKSLEKALEIALDWLKQNPIDASDPATQAWRRGNAAWRAQAIGYLFRAGVEAKLLDEDQEELLLKSAREHAVWLLSDEHYLRRSDEGQLQDYGLVVICAQLNKITDCKTWKGIVSKRFVKNVRATTSKKAAIALNHSPTAHFSVLSLVSKMADLTKDSDIQRLEKQMNESAGWLVPPDGKHLILGASKGGTAPKWAVKRAQKLSGFSPFDDLGWSIVKKKDSYLLASAAHHPDNFKQADELTFSWSELGERVISDTGFYAYSRKSSEARYANSSRAHNTLTADGEDFKVGKPYGSAIRAVGEDAGWYVIMANNPAISAQQVAHERVWLYRPGEWLVVVDKVGSPKKRTYDRYFHFWYEVDVKLSDEGVATANIKKKPLSVRDFSSEKVEAKLVKKQDKPLQGMMFPKGRQSAKANQVLQLTSEGDRGVYAVAFRLGEPLPEKLSASIDDSQVYRIELGDESFTLSRDRRKVLFKPPPKKEGEKGSGDKDEKANDDEGAAEKGNAAKKSDKPGSEAPGAQPAGAAKPKSAPAAPKPAPAKPAAPKAPAAP